MSTEVAATSWADALPRVVEEEAEARRRVGPLLERLSHWGPLFAEALPRALAGLWPAEPDAPESPVVQLGIDGPGVALKQLRLERFPVRIGRGEGCVLQLPSPAVSTEHAELRMQEERLILIDLRSTNGTKHNGEKLVPLDPVELAPGDTVELGPFTLTPQSVESASSRPAFEARATPPSAQPREVLFGASHPSDRWVRVRWAAETVWVRVPAGWIRSAWQHVSALPAREGDDVDPMEEGAAQYVLVQIARALSRETGQQLDLSAWLTPDEVRRTAREEGPWLGSEVRLRARRHELHSALAFPPSEPEPALTRSRFADLQWPASVCLGLVRLTLSDWRGVEPGDALLPDVWWPENWKPALDAKVKDLGPAYLRVRRAWHGARLLRSGAGVNLRLDSPWLESPGGEWLMAEEDSPGAATPSSLSADDLELQVVVELDRFPVTLGELQRWRPGEVLNLRQKPSDPVRLVVETGLQRRVLGEGRVVVVNDRLAIEIVRILTRFEDSTPRS